MATVLLPSLFFRKKDHLSTITTDHITYLVLLLLSVRFFPALCVSTHSHHHHHPIFAKDAPSSPIFIIGIGIKYNMVHAVKRLLYKTGLNKTLRLQIAVVVVSRYSTNGGNSRRRWRMKRRLLQTTHFFHSRVLPLALPPPLLILQRPFCGDD